MYDTTDYPEDIRHTNPEYLRRLARRLERTAATLTEGSVADYALNVSREIEDTAVDISWTLGTITNDLVVSYSRDTKRPLAGNGAVLAAAASGCAAPLGNALKHLATAADRLSAPHAVHRSKNAAVQVPEELVPPLRRDISRAGAAIRKCAKQFRENAALLDHQASVDGTTSST
jgi:hypothetical protein